MAVVELVWAVDRLKLFNRLEEENRDDTFALRGMLWFLTTGLVKEGQVFVDDWPKFSHVCCLHSSKLYSKNSDRDMITISTMDFDNFTPFFISFVKNRKWNQRDGVIMCYVEEQIAHLAEEILYTPFKSASTFWKSQPMRHYTVPTNATLDMRAYLEIERSNRFKMTPGLELDRLRPEEAHLVVKQWPYEIPEKEEMFRWLIATLPSSCIRDPQGKPVAWACMYSFCAGGAAYVYPEYRGKYLVENYATPLMKVMYQMSPSHRFFWILDDNVASQRQVERSSPVLRRTDTFVYWLAFTPTATKGNSIEETKSLKSKL